MTEKEESEFNALLKEKLKEMQIKGMIQGFEIANQMLYEYCDEHSIEEIKAFTKKNLEKKTEKKLESIIKSTKDGE